MSKHTDTTPAEDRPKPQRGTLPTPDGGLSALVGGVVPTTTPDVVDPVVGVPLGGPHAPAPTPRAGRAVRFAASLVVRRVVAHNPKVPGSASRARFEGYPPAGQPITVGDLLARGEGNPKGTPHRGDLAWDLKHGFITISER